MRRWSDRIAGGLAQCRAHEDERGQGLTEYGLILVLIAVVVIFTLQILGHQTNNLYSNISNGLNR